MNLLNKIKTVLRKNNFSFSGGAEDITLKSIFTQMGIKKGFYIDIGAYHPYKESNTYAFYLQGWNGINIEPRPGSKKLFDKYRPNDINIQLGVAEHEGRMTYYHHPEANRVGANTFSKEYLMKFPEEVIRTTQECLITVMPLKIILSNMVVPEIDFMDVDCECQDLQVLMSNDWEKYRPKIIVAELECNNINDLATNPTAEYLKSVGYEAIAKNFLVENYASVFFRRCL